MTDIDALLAKVEQWANAAILAHEGGGMSRLRPVLLVEYRCRVRGCLLLHAWQSPEGVMYYAPGHKVSAARNEEWPMFVTPEWKRQHKPPSAGMLDFFGPSGRVPMGLRCDHLAMTVDPQDVRTDAESTTPGKPVRRALPTE